MYEALILMVLATALSVALLAVLVRELRHDGYGSRPAPRSHHDEVDLRLAH